MITSRIYKATECQRDVSVFPQLQSLYVTDKFVI